MHVLLATLMIGLMHDFFSLLNHFSFQFLLPPTFPNQLLTLTCWSPLFAPALLVNANTVLLHYISKVAQTEHFLPAKKKSHSTPRNFQAEPKDMFKEKPQYENVGTRTNKWPMLCDCFDNLHAYILKRCAQKNNSVWKLYMQYQHYYAYICIYIFIYTHIYIHMLILHGNSSLKLYVWYFFTSCSYIQYFFASNKAAHNFNYLYMLYVLLEQYTILHWSWFLYHVSSLSFFTRDSTHLHVYYMINANMFVS